MEGIDEIQGKCEVNGMSSGWFCFDSAHRRLKNLINNITLDHCVPFPETVEGIFPSPATTQKVYQSIE